jgi:hypothetical protein
MALYRSRDDNGVKVARGKELLWSSNSLEIRIQRADMFYACDVQVTDCFEAAIRKTFDGAN